MPSALHLVPHRFRRVRVGHHVGASIAGGNFNAGAYVTQSSDGGFTFDASGALSGAVAAGVPAAINALANSALLPAPLAGDLSTAMSAMGAIAAAGGASAAASGGLGVVALAVFSAFYAVTLIPGVGASGGPGDQCCSSGVSTRYGSCDPSEFTWEAMWGSPDPGMSVPGSFEAFANASIIKAYDQLSDCNHLADTAAFAAGMLPALIAAWNKTHSSQGTATVQPIPGDAMGRYVVPNSGGTRKIQVMCNVDPNPGSSAGFQSGEPGGNDPISVALNYIAQLMNCPSFTTDPFGCTSSTGAFPVNGMMSITVNNGPPIPASLSESNIIPTGMSLISSSSPSGPGVIPHIAVPAGLPIPSIAVPVPPTPSLVGPITLLGSAGALAFGFPVVAASVLLVGSVAGFVEALREL